MVHFISIPYLLEKPRVVGDCFPPYYATALYSCLGWLNDENVDYPGIGKYVMQLNCDAAERKTKTINARKHLKSKES